LLALLDLRLLFHFPPTVLDTCSDTRYT
jgi:hypothetical protein